jgi:signal transduction histidine kinase
VTERTRELTALLELSTENEAVILEVRDDGVGFDTSSSFPGHIGLVSMRERAASVSAVLEIGSAPGAGTTVRLWLPRNP